jgi:uncharacterized protein YcaQ
MPGPALLQLTPGQARRAALAAQGFVGGFPRRLDAGVQRVGLLQIDSVNVLARAHYLPLYSRRGPYDRAALDALAVPAKGRPPQLFEYWGHEASLLPVGLQPLLRWRMAAGHGWSGPARIARDRPEVVAEVRRQVHDRGPVTAAEVEAELRQHAARSQDYGWGWNWSDVKRALEHLFWVGEVTAAGRDRAFARRYDLTERVLPAAVLAAPTPPQADAVRALVLRSAQALGPATAADLADYYRLRAGPAKQAVEELVESGELVAAAVPGWPAAYAPADLRVPRTAAGATALLAPFDPLVWTRARAERVFGMRYRLEIYVPAAQRRYGYYVLPFLHRGRLRARVDLKADRTQRLLRVQSAWGEPDPAMAADLAEHLRLLAAWLGLDDVVHSGRGDLSRWLDRTLE